MNRKSILTCALAALGLLSQAKADNVIYLTGSTAFRGIVMNQLADNTGPVSGGGTGIFDAGTVNLLVFFGGSSSGKSTYALFHGSIGGTPTFVDCLWSGSEAGIAAVANVNGTTLNDGAQLAGVPCTFLTTNGWSGNQTNSGLPSVGQLQNSTTQPDLAFADTSQTVSLTAPVGNNALTEFGICGIIPFTWAKGQVNNTDVAWTNLVNVTHEQLFEELGSAQTADFFNSGQPGGFFDFDHTVYLLGRNKGSGTRVNTLIDIGYPYHNPINQYQVNSTVGLNTANGLYGLFETNAGAPYLINTIATVNPADGNSLPADNGYETGGDVVKALNVPGSGITFPGTSAKVLTIGYAGIGDAGGLPGGLTGPYILTLNGVHESDGAIESGTYSFWGHEHIYGQHTISNPAVTAANVLKVYDSIKKQLDNNDVTKGSGLNDKADPFTLHSSGILGVYMTADKTAQADTGFPVYGAAAGAYTIYGSGHDQ